ncbi:hypothetical protein J3486_38960 [Streptomyces sp. VRA16 Mangrove soil]|nr:hypothetical protein [Streptomyces sp. VRA16 Mangrove soil]
MSAASHATPEEQLALLLGRSINSFELPDETLEDIYCALAYDTSLHSAHHSAGLHRETYRHTWLLADGRALTLWELVHNTGRDHITQHEVYVTEDEVHLATGRLPMPPEATPGFELEVSIAPEPTEGQGATGVSGTTGAPGTTGTHGATDPSGAVDSTDASRASEAPWPGDAHETPVTGIPGFPVQLPPIPPQRRVFGPADPDSSVDHARRLLRRAENPEVETRPGPGTARLLREACAHQITQAFGCRLSPGFALYEHAFLLCDGCEVSLWEVEHTATPDGRHMCEVYLTQSAARAAIERRAAARTRH